MPDLFRQKLQSQADLLAKLKKTHFETHGPNKHEQFMRIKEEEQRLANAARSNISDLTIDYRIQFAEIFCDGGGFDIVIMNPPYVATYSRQSEKATVVHEQQLKGMYGSYGGRLNLFTCFIIRAMGLSDRNGIVVFIVPDSYATSDSYRKIRREYAEHFSMHSWTLVRPPIFGAAVRNVIVIAGPGNEQLCAIVARTTEDLYRLTNLHALSHNTIWGTNDRVAFFSSRAEQDIWMKLSGHEQRFGELFDTKDGVNPGPRNVRDRIVNPSEASSHDRPLIEGRNISPSGYIVNPPYHVIRYEPSGLSPKEKKSGASLRDPRIFESPKIVSRQTADTLIAGMDWDEDLVTLNSVHTTRSIRGSTDELWGALALLNSPLARLYYAIDGGETRELLPQVHISWIRTFPLPKHADQVFVNLANLGKVVYSEMKAGKIASCENVAIHKATCEAYDLSQNETDQVLKMYLERYPRYAEVWSATRLDTK